MPFQNPKPVTRVHFRNPAGNMFLQTKDGNGFGCDVCDETFEVAAMRMAVEDLDFHIDPKKLVFTQTRFIPGSDPSVEQHFEYVLNPVELALLPPHLVWGSTPSDTYVSPYSPASSNKTIPVAVGIIEHPIDALILIGERGIEPAIGRRALFGGYVELETLDTAVQREVAEEAGVSMSCTPQYMGSALGHNSRLLVFYRMRATEAEVDLFKPSSEMQALYWEDSIAIEQNPLGFPLHQEFALRALNKRVHEFVQDGHIPNL